MTGSVRDQPKHEKRFFENENGCIDYHNYCKSCTKQCKQSYRCSSINCPVKIKAHTPDQYIAIIKKTGRKIETVGKEIGVDSRTVRSMLYERQDMSTEVYEKLEELFYKNKTK